MTRPHIVVIGGGITGLSLAFTLDGEARARRLPVDVTVLEGADREGGHATTIEEDGFLVEAGPNGFLDREPETVALTRALGLEARLVEARPEAKRRFIVRGGRLCRVPESPPALLTSDALSLRGKLRLLLEPFAPGPPAGVDETVFDFASRRIGPEAAELLVDAAVSGISAGDSKTLSVAAQFPLMTEMEREHGSLIKAMIARRRRGTGPSRLLSFDRGVSVLTGALATSLGARLRTGVSVDTVSHEQGRWRVALSDGETLEADRVVLTVPARVAATLVRHMDPSLATALGTIAYSGVSLVALAYRVQDIPRPLNGYGYLVTRPENLATLGVVWESSLFPGRAPAGMALLRVFMGGARRPLLVEEAPSAIVCQAREELGRLMGIQAAPQRSWQFAWPNAIAQYTVGHLGRVASIRDRVRLHAGLDVCGTSYDGVSFNHAIASARRHARLLADEIQAQAAAAA